MVGKGRISGELVEGEGWGERSAAWQLRTWKVIYPVSASRLHFGRSVSRLLLLKVDIHSNGGNGLGW